MGRGRHHAALTARNMPEGPGPNHPFGLLGNTAIETG